jgi:hypothetical protein
MQLASSTNHCVHHIYQLKKLASEQIDNQRERISGQIDNGDKIRTRRVCIPHAARSLTDRTCGAAMAEQYTSTSARGQLLQSLPRQAATIVDPAITADPSGSSPILRAASNVIPDLEFPSTRPSDERSDERRSRVASTLSSSTVASRKNAWS